MCIVTILGTWVDRNGQGPDDVSAFVPKEPPIFRYFPSSIIFLFKPGSGGDKDVIITKRVVVGVDVIYKSYCSGKSYLADQNFSCTCQ